LEEEYLENEKRWEKIGYLKKNSQKNSSLEADVKS
jgi:hypothetical protein